MEGKFSISNTSIKIYIQVLYEMSIIGAIIITGYINYFTLQYNTTNEKKKPESKNY